MSKVKLLFDVVEDMRRLADSIQAVAEAMTGNETPQLASAPIETPAALEKKITLEEVRAVLAEKSHDGLTAEVRELLQKYGASKLSGIAPKHYAALLKDAEGLKGPQKPPTDLLGRGGAAK